MKFCALNTLKLWISHISFCSVDELKVCTPSVFNIRPTCSGTDKKMPGFIQESGKEMLVAWRWRGNGDDGSDNWIGDCKGEISGCDGCRGDWGGSDSWNGDNGSKGENKHSREWKEERL